MSVVVEPYSEKAIVVRNTLEHHGPIMTELGGTFNEKLKGGRGWIFSKYKFNQVKPIVDKLNSGQYGNEFEKKTETGPLSSSASCSASAGVSASATQETVSKSEYLSLLSRVERLEALVSSRLGTRSPDQVESKSDMETRVKERVVERVPSKPVEVRSTTPDINEEEEYEPKKRLVQMRK
jgi:hypothetical protein